MSDMLREFFSTDWEAMTHADWTGLIIVVALAGLMIGIYFWTFRPSNKENFEQYRDFVNQVEDHNEETRREVEHGKAR